MKRSLVTIVIMMALTTAANAAVETGDLDLNFGFNWQSDNGTNGAADREVMDLSLGVDYFVTNRISLGIAYSSQSTDQSSSVSPNEETENAWSLRIKYYILKRERLLPYVGFAYKFIDWEKKNGIISQNAKDNGTSFLLGLRYAITERNHAYLEYQINSYGNKWPYNVDGGSKILIGLIHQVN